MGRLIFDTSVWINFFQDRTNQEVDLLSKQLNQGLRPHIIPKIIQEILQGVRNDEKYLYIKDLLLATIVVESDFLLASIGAAELYRSLRKKGITIRKPNDCLIAWYAIHHNLTLVHNDRDFDIISEHIDLKTLQEQ